ncbi:MAG: glucosamine-6-phosphate deaminase [Bacteroidales bacterium]|nr:glucosamine-6-phosphate deaminase [Bacteroidales bacterium]HPE87623.1 glucosamine-6-phosphate deaminase [Bacteroidales bacterium]
MEKNPEKIPVYIYSGSQEGSCAVAGEIAALIRQKTKRDEYTVLGLATGSTPTEVYKELIRLHREEGLSFRKVITFNLDEYYPMQPDSLQSYVHFMQEHLFKHIDILPENIHIPDGTVEKSKVEEYCRQYEEKIDNAGGIDLQLLGIGRTGHIGFNEPGSPVDSTTRRITLDHLTRTDASSDFFGEENVPKTAITMGIGTILSAKRIILMAFGEGKAPIIKESVEGPVKETIPATYLQRHSHASIILTPSSAAELTRIKTPWLTGSCNWNDRVIRKAVVWLCQKTGKPILKLTDRDYQDHGMGELITEVGSAYYINIKVFNDLQHTITGWPGGKPNADDTQRPERAQPFPKRIVVFSPHPDDDVISMGGTLHRLVQQGHEVHVVYQTSGSIAVFDDDVIRFLDFVNAYSHLFVTHEAQQNERYKEIYRYIQNKHAGQSDTQEIIDIKTAIRCGEAKAACRYLSIPEEHIHFLNMPFYETGKIRKKELSEADYQLIATILNDIRPHQIYAAGDLSDPHGTHRQCLKAILHVLRQLTDTPWMKTCFVWLYRGAWQEWDIDQVDMAVPLSPDEVMTKRRAIFKHQSQKDRPLFPGHDSREFWQRAEQRNQATAQWYDKLGMAEYQAIEVFARHFPGEEVAG